MYCGKIRSYNLSGANFAVYDDGFKEEKGVRAPESATHPRRQLASLIFNKSSSRRQPMTMRVLLPTQETLLTDRKDDELRDGLHETLLALPPGVDTPPSGTALLRLVPPRCVVPQRVRG